MGGSTRHVPHLAIGMVDKSCTSAPLMQALLLNQSGTLWFSRHLSSESLTAVSANLQ
jgi:hypothetical protein